MPLDLYTLSEEVAGFLDLRGDAATAALAETHLPIVIALVKGYTRGNGFDNDGIPADDVAAVITAATARLMSNPAQVAYDVGSVAMRGSFQGWTLAEQIILNRYRKRAA